MTVYILHFNERIGSVRQSAQHYCGFTDREFNVRAKEHLIKNNVPIVRAFRSAGIGFTIGRLWMDGNRDFEMRIKKHYKNVKSFCLICREHKIIGKQIGVEKFMSDISTKYYVCGISDDGGKTLIGKPGVYTSVELAEERRKAQEYTDGNIDVIVLHEFTVKHTAQEKSGQTEQSEADALSWEVDIPF